MVTNISPCHPVGNWQRSKKIAEKVKEVAYIATIFESFSALLYFSFCKNKAFILLKGGRTKDTQVSTEPPALFSSEAS